MQIEFIDKVKKGIYESCFIMTTEILAINDAYNSNSIKLSIFISDEENINEKWTLTANGVCNYTILYHIGYKMYD